MKQQETRKTVWLKDLVVGTITTVIAGAGNISAGETGACSFTMYDKSDEVDAVIPAGRKGDTLTDGVYVFEMSVVLKKGHKQAIIKKWRRAEESDNYSPMDIYTGISGEKAALYEKVIRGAVRAVTKQDKEQRGFDKLLNLYYTEEEFSVLSTRPASVNGAGRYGGGALALVANLAVLTKDFAYDLQQMGNGLYGETCDYALLITASLLSMSGVRDYIGDDNMKTSRGLARGYYSVMQTRLEPLMEKAGISEYESDRLLNMLHCMFPGTGALKSITWEASICRAIMALYTEMDEVSAYLAESPSDEELARGYRYSERLNRLFVLPEAATVKGDGDVDENAS